MTYDQAIGRVSRDEFEKSSKFDRMNEDKESIAAKWDSIDTGRGLEKEDPKQFNANVAAKVELLQQLRADGKLKKDYSDELSKNLKLVNFSISSRNKNSRFIKTRSK